MRPLVCLCVGLAALLVAALVYADLTATKMTTYAVLENNRIQATKLNTYVVLCESAAACQPVAPAKRSPTVLMSN